MRSSKVPAWFHAEPSCCTVDAAAAAVGVTSIFCGAMSPISCFSSWLSSRWKYGRPFLYPRTSDGRSGSSSTTSVLAELLVVDEELFAAGLDDGGALLLVLVLLVVDLAGGGRRGASVLGASGFLQMRL